MKLAQLFFIAILSISLSFACSRSDQQAAAVELVPQDIGDASCELCGMVVSEQPAPRAQVVHRDGHRSMLCSVAELPAYLDAPSVHGKPSAVFVEVLPADVDPSATNNSAHVWKAAEGLSYVIGGPMRPVMGESVLVFANLTDAQLQAVAFDGRVLDFEGLKGHIRAGLNGKQLPVDHDHGEKQ